MMNQKEDIDNPDRYGNLVWFKIIWRCRKGQGSIVSSGRQKTESK